MDQDQFGGRTDDDLFSDDIEPVEEQVEETIDVPEPTPVPTRDAPAQPEPAPAPAVVKPAPARPPQPAKSALAQSRHAPRPDNNPPHSTPKNNNNSTPKNNNNNKNHKKARSPKPPPSVATSDTPSTQESPATPASTDGSTPTPTVTNTTSSASTPQPTTTPTTGSNNTASAVSHARLNSGANPRTKLTDTELAARMEKMRLLAAEKTRRFEEAQRDESEHAVAYARGMEEARRRKAEDAARRCVAEEERKKLEDERARNRERKLKAMGMKEGGGRGGRGGGRALFDEREGEFNRDQGRRQEGPAPAPPPLKKADLKKEDFPALPSSSAAPPKKVDTAWVAKPDVIDYPVSSPIGKWDEEVAATLDNPS
ncbi:hypothetical protein F5144DRAFT_544456 [Chaetomium tenue]|uniref:Uncharacterized protein n=1 Tax=Chaetomium tenue TaxID=1854479 RepID=A0ACB7PJJ5_9PEZI|nr:hypothetical protein F5144DRAFT_544456 [Chaetomium globosum]